MRDYADVWMLRAWFPGHDPLDWSWRLNMALWHQGNDRGKPKDVVADALGDMVDDLKAGLLE